MASNFAEETLCLLKEAFPSAKIITEYYVQHMGSRLYFDFYLPALNILIECQGEQHYKFVSYFHGNMREYKESRRRDQLKREWSQQQGIPLLELKFNKRPSNSVQLFKMIYEVVFRE